MANTLKLKRSAVQNKVPTTGDLQLGELALNTYDGKLYTLKDNGTPSVVQIGATAITPNALTLGTSGTGLSGSATFNGSSAVTFTVDSNATNANTPSTIVARDASGGFSAGTITLSNLIASGDGSTLYGPNTTWGQYLRIGGNGNADTTNASVVTTNGNLYIDAKTGTFATYINYYKGTGGVAFGSGAAALVAWMGSDGDLWKGNADNTGSKYWHAGNDGSGSGLDADLLDGQQGSYYLNWGNVTNKPSPVITVTLSGDVTGTANTTITNLSNSTISIATTIAANSVALGTDTTGNYVAGVSAGSGIVVSGTAGEGWSPTVTHADTSSQGSVNNSNGTVIQDITLDGFGHITAIESTDLDGRYYTETESDARFLGINAKAADSNLLDGIDSGSFLRSDANDSASGQITLSNGLYVSAGDIYSGTAAFIASDADGAFSDRSGANIDHIWHNDSTNTWHFCSDTSYKNGGNSIVYANTFSASGNTVWHAGNDGSGSGLDADTVDGIQGSSIVTTTTITNHSINPKFSTTIGFGNDSEILKYNDGTNESRSGYWSSKDGFYIQGDSNSVNNVVLKTGNLDINQNAYIVGSLGVGGSGYFSGGISAEAGTRANITTRVPSGFWQDGGSATTAEGWPQTTNTWYHLISSTHSNTGNYHSMQFAGSFYNSNDIFYRSTANSGTTAWNKIWHAGNDGSGSGLDADTVDGIQGGSFLRSDAADTASGEILFASARTDFGSNGDWNDVGFSNITNLHGRDHNQFWFGTGNGTWFTGTANTKSQASGLAADASFAHDLLISTMQSDATYDRGITFAVDNTGAGNSGWRLGKWHSGDAKDSSKFVVDGQLFAKAGYTDEYDYYTDDYSAKYSSQGSSHWGGDSGYGWNVPGVVSSSAIQIQSGNAETNSRKPQLQFHQYGYGGLAIEYDGPNDTLNIIAPTSRLSNTGFKQQGNTIWHAGNDGSGSGLDADTLDGQQGSYYLDTSATTQTKSGGLNVSGNVGIGTTNPQYKLEVNGSFAATTKSFVIPHPTKPGYRLRHGSLEGPENGVYARGRSKDFIIELPEYWVKLVDADSITVNLTPVGKSQTLWVKDIKDNKIYVGSKCSEVHYFYTVFAERADVDPLEVEIDCSKMV